MSRVGRSTCGPSETVELTTLITERKYHAIVAPMAYPIDVESTNEFDSFQITAIVRRRTPFFYHAIFSIIC
ncbi:hypothetical protein ACN38_g1596 [Penicillium nordicum]|uniref:Uncharacterized protein n=1 Tax=Penicillium nordicum TaxID=229535 RepID=A0A0M8PG38_9EURO|nr:hypothetical protein ACN38_g1596 [Penicillium nordicum]